MKRSNIVLHIIIAVLFAAELVSRWNNYHLFEYLVKPWLMIWVVIYFYLNTREFKTSLFIYLAFLFCWIGDLFLMVAHSNEMLFYAGVGGFFLAQLSYLKHFLNKTNSDNRGYLFHNPILILPFIVYIVTILFLISDGINGIMIPIILVYSVSLIAMSMTAMNRKGLVNNLSFRLVFIGSVFFVISDSLIALNKFYVVIPRASFLIMLTYFIAQYLIMQGLLYKDRQYQEEISDFGIQISD